MYVQQDYLMKNKTNKETESMFYYGCTIQLTFFYLILL